MGLLDRAIGKLPKQYQGLAGQIAKQVQEHQAQQTGQQHRPQGQQPYAQQPCDQSGGQRPGHQPNQHGQQPAPSWGPPVQQGQSAPAGRRTLSADEQAVARYRYLLQTAPPHELEQAHAEAFARLSPQQRQLVLAEVSQGLPEQERPTSTEPRDLARAATRAEVRQPGFLSKAFSGRNLGKAGVAGLGVAAGATVLGTMGALVVGSTVGSALLEGVDLGEIAGLADLGDLGGLGDLAGGVGELGDQVGALGDQVGALGDVGVDGLADSASQAVDGVAGDLAGDLGGDVGALGDQVGALGEGVTGLGDGVSQAGEGLGGSLGDIFGDVKLPWD